MFAIPGIFGMIFFIYLRPQEAYTALQGVPFLNLFFALALFGAGVDLRLRVTRAGAVPQLSWLVVFFLWSLLTVAIVKPATLMSNGIALFITVALFVLVAQSVQSFRIFEKLALLMICVSMVLTLIAIHQSVSPKQCVMYPPDTDNYGGIGEPDGRSCQKRWQCFGAEAEPGAEYICEKVGLLGTHSHGDRVRYRGVLQDPNELAACMSSGFALLLGLWIRLRKRWMTPVVVLSFLAVGLAVKETGSRSGQLGLLAVLGVFLLWRFGRKIAYLGAPFAVPVLLLLAKGGSDRADADESTALRYDAWRAGMDMFRQSPLYGVGLGQYTDHHFLTAHNSYILILAELGFVGVFIFTMLIWLSLKVPLIAIGRYRGHSEARVAEVWSVSCLAAMAAVLCGGLFLSFSYHYMLWLYLGLTGGLFMAIKKHDPDFEVSVGVKDLVGVLIVDCVLWAVIMVFLRLKGH